MQRGRNTLILLVLAAAIGAYWLLRRVEAHPGVRGERRRRRNARQGVRQARYDEDRRHHRPRLRRRDDAAEEDRQRLADRRADRQARLTRPKSAAWSRISAPSKSADVVDQDPKDLTKYGLAKPRIERPVHRRRQDRSSTAGRIEDAHRRRPLRQAGEREEGHPDSGVSGGDLRSHDVPAARQVDPQVRSRQGRPRRGHQQRRRAEVREARRRLEDDRAGRGAH